MLRDWLRSKPSPTSAFQTGYGEGYLCGSSPNPSHLLLFGLVWLAAEAVGISATNWLSAAVVEYGSISLGGVDFVEESYQNRLV